MQAKVRKFVFLFLLAGLFLLLGAGGLVAYDMALEEFAPRTWYWRPESKLRRFLLPKYKVTPAAILSRLTPAENSYRPEEFEKWERSHGNAANSHFSSLSQINKGNVRFLREAWVYHSGLPYTNIQANPIVAGERVFFPISADTLVAVNAVTGKEIWRFKGKATIAKRGLLYWPGESGLAARLFFASGAQLCAIYANAGTPVKDFGKGGCAGSGLGSAAPVAGNGLIIFPSFRDPENPGICASLEAFDLRNGKLVWRTALLEKNSEAIKFAVDPDPEGGHPWSGIALDKKRGIIFATTGNPRPDFVGTSRPGADKNADSIVAVEEKTGRILWNFQEVSHDIWDRDIPSPPILTQITKEGRAIDVVVAVSKIGNTIILDRVSGALVYPWRMRRAPTSETPGEHTAAYQPDVEIPEPFSSAEFKRSDLFERDGLPLSAAQTVARAALYGFFEPHAPEKWTANLATLGGAEWPGASVDPRSGVLYVASSKFAHLISNMEISRYDDNRNDPSMGGKIYAKACLRCHGLRPNSDSNAPLLHFLSKHTDIKSAEEVIRNGDQIGMPPFPDLDQKQMKALLEFIFNDKTILEKRHNFIGDIKPEHRLLSMVPLMDVQGMPAIRPPWGALTAIDLNTGKKNWQVPLGTFPNFKEAGALNWGAPVATAGGLIFVAGTTDEMFRAFAQDTGEMLWEYRLPAYGSAAPVVYQARGTEYVMLPATGRFSRMSDAFVAFKLSR